MKQASNIVLGIFLGQIKYSEAMKSQSSSSVDELIQAESLATLGRHHRKHHKYHNNLHSRDNGQYQHLSQGPLETDNTNPFIIFGPPTTPGETPGGALYKSALNATPKANITHQNWTNNTWGINRVLKYAGDRETYFNSSPAGYSEGEELKWEESKYNSTKELTEEEQKEVNEKAADMAKLSAHKHLEQSVWMSQKGIYPVKDSRSYISPYSQRDHSWTDGQYNQSNEVTWSGETNTTAADHIDWVANDGGRLAPAAATTLAQKRQKWIPFHDAQSTISAYDQRDDAWTDNQADKTNEAEWQAHISAVGADYLDSAQNPLELPAALVQRKRQIYPVKDSKSYISPYSQRDHSWNDAQYNQSNEVTWSKETNVTAADHIDWVANDGGRLAPAAATTLAQKKQRFIPFHDKQSKISSYESRDDAWTNDQADKSNEAQWKAHIAAVGADYLDSAETANEEIKTNTAKVASLVQRQRQIYPVKDSKSYISPYSQRDHSWNDAQYNQSNEVTWSKETNVTAADHIDWVANDGGRLAPAAATTLAQKRQRHIPYHDAQSSIKAYDQRDDAWTDNQADKTNEAEWQAHISAVGADYLDSAQNPLVLPEALVQRKRQIYPVKDSKSYISPYSQRDHSWTDGQYNQSNEVTWSKETNVTAADHIDWVANDGGRLAPAAATLAQKKQKWIPFHDAQSTISAYDQRDDAWTDNQADKTNEAEWQAHISAVGADYLDSAQNPLVLPAALVQRKRQIYPVKDSKSYISPYSQRDHSWNDAQYNQSNEVTWSGETNTTAADHIDWVANDGGRLAPAAASTLAQQKWIPFHDAQSTISAYDQRDDAWTDNQADKTNEAEWQAHIQAVGADYLDSAQNPLVLPAALVQRKNLIYPVKDSKSYISPYSQRDHSWNDAQYNQSNEVTWSGETNTTAADHIDWVANDGGRLAPAAASTLAQQKWIPFHDKQSKIAEYDQRDDAWTDTQESHTNSDGWSKHIETVGADYLNSAQNPLELPAALAQRQIYPVKDSKSYISPYSQRDHSWNDAQYNQSNEVTWSGETNTTAADHIDWVANDGGRLAPAAATTLVQRQIYPVKDSKSYISPYSQRDHSWNDAQYNQSNEVTWSKETNTTAADHIDWVANDGGRLAPAAASTLAQQKWIPFHDHQSTISKYEQRDDAWTNNQADKSNEAEWKAHISAVGADYLDSAETASETITPNANPLAALVQKDSVTYPVKDSHSYIDPYNQRDHAWNETQHNHSNEVEWSRETNKTAADYTHVVNNEGGRLAPALAQKVQATYPAKDSHSYITPYSQRDHSWTDKQYDHSDEVKWSAETNTTAADHIDHVKNEAPSRLVPAAANASTLAQQKEKYRVETHSVIIPYVVRDNAWNFDHHDNTNFTRYKEDIPTGYAASQDFVDPPVIPDGTTNTTLVPCTTAEEAEYAAEVIANANANLPPPVATCLTKAAAALKASTCSVESPTCQCNATPAHGNASNSSNASKVCHVINATNASNATNATNATAPADSSALKVKKATVANASKVGEKKTDVPKVTAPVAKPNANKDEAKPNATKGAAKKNATKVSTPPVAAKKNATVKTNAPIAKETKVSVNKTAAATPVKVAAKKDEKPAFAPKGNATNSSAPAKKVVEVKKPSNPTKAAANTTKPAAVKK